jgi:hypothetical protein
MFHRTVIKGPCREQNICQRHPMMARMLDAVSGSAESGSTSEQCVEEHTPYRVGFERTQGDAPRGAPAAVPAPEAPLSVEALRRLRWEQEFRGLAVRAGARSLIPARARRRWRRRGLASERLRWGCVRRLLWASRMPGPRRRRAGACPTDAGHLRGGGGRSAGAAGERAAGLGCKVYERKQRD